jgi:hypothetical protein
VSPVYPVPVSGLCSRSTDQWTAGLVSDLQLFNSSCLDSNNVNDQTATLFRTAPLTHDLPIFGPIDAHLYVDSTTGDGMLSVAVDDVAPDGSVSRLTGGWQVISLRALDRSRTRYLDGQVLQPYHPFTQDSKAVAKPGQVVPVDVEIFPTGADIQPGHRLELSVQSFDVPHLAPTLPDLAGTLGIIHVHASAAYPSALVLPTRDRGTGGVTPSPTPSPSPTVTTTPAGTALPATTASRPTLHLRVHGHRVVVKAQGVRGRIRLRLDGHRVATKRLHDGKVVFVLHHLRRGRHLVKAIHLGAPRLTAATRFRVRR